MSGAGTPFDRFTGGNAMMPPRQVAQPAPAAPAQPQQPWHHIPMHVTRKAHANVDQETMIKRRDAMGDVADELAKVMNSDDPNRADIVAYLGGMVGKGVVAPEEATQLLQMLPEDSAGIKRWAQVMFSAAMNVGIHAHAGYPTEVFPGEGQEPAQESTNE